MTMPASDALPTIPPAPLPWLDDVVHSHTELRKLTDRFGSPLHLHHTAPFLENIDNLVGSAATSGIELDVYFARKANKALCYVDAAITAGIGVDVASAEELDQALTRNADPGRLVVTSAVKPDALLTTCIENDVLVVIDNHDEAARYVELAQNTGRRPPVAIRVSNFAFERRRPGPSRFGVDIRSQDLVADITRYHTSLDIRGLHFHLDGYAHSDRVDALAETLGLHDNLAQAGLEIQFIDIGGGFPVAYTDRPDNWERFWDQLDRALLGERSQVTYRNHAYGQIVDNGRVLGERHAYPHYQHLIDGDWLESILAARPPHAGRTIAQQFLDRDLRLRCEPGRALLDGCGATVASLVHLKPLDEDLLIGLDVNSSNCRTQKSELLTDPLHLHPTPRPEAPCSGYLTGAYCSESDLITHRRLTFAHPPERGDLFVFPNTAGYYMHFTESRSHQLPLPLNIQRTADTWVIDPIDRPEDEVRSGSVQNRRN